MLHPDQYVAVGIGVELGPNHGWNRVIRARLLFHQGPGEI